MLPTFIKAKQNQKSLSEKKGISNIGIISAKGKLPSTVSHWCYFTIFEMSIHK